MQIDLLKLHVRDDVPNLDLLDPSLCLSLNHPPAVQTFPLLPSA